MVPLRVSAPWGLRSTRTSRVRMGQSFPWRRRAGWIRWRRCGRWRAAAWIGMSFRSCSGRCRWARPTSMPSWRMPACRRSRPGRSLTCCASTSMAGSVFGPRRRQPAQRRRRGRSVCRRGCITTEQRAPKQATRWRSCSFCRGARTCRSAPWPSERWLASWSWRGFPCRAASSRGTRRFRRQASCRSTVSRRSPRGQDSVWGFASCSGTAWLAATSPSIWPRRSPTPRCRFGSQPCEG
mmetsp:Transcript_1059/g.4362  ORF Transcript_1059/g.4362 Transcript_1059/m.4362 type:complete len:238 (-) Transcript_1059:2790-3503(-)